MIKRCDHYFKRVLNDFHFLLNFHSFLKMASFPSIPHTKILTQLYFTFVRQLICVFLHLPVFLHQM